MRPSNSHKLVTVGLLALLVKITPAFQSCMVLAPVTMISIEAVKRDRAAKK